jgi:hypothetical protein
MAFVDRDELERLRAVDAQHDQLVADNERLQHRLAVREPVGRVAVEVEEQLEAADNQAYVGAEAQRMAQIAVFNAERSTMIEEQASELQRTHYDEYAAQLRETEGPAVRQRLDEQFKTDGTYTRIETDARRDVTAQIRTTLLEEKRAEVDAEVATDEERARITAQLRGEVETSDEIMDYRQQVRRDREDVWAADVKAAVQQEVEAEEAAREDTFKAEYGQRVRTSDATERQRQAIRRDLEKKWRDATDQEIVDAVEDEELKTLLETRAEQVREKLRRETIVHELLSNFEGLGIDTEKIEENMKLVVLLGKVGQVKVKEKYKDSWDNTQTRDIEATGVHCARKITFVSLGDGRFIVDGDSLHDSSSVYERNDAIPLGTVVVLGRKVQENGSQKLDHHVAADVPFFYDDDTTTPNIIDSQLCIADVRVNGTSARSLKHIVMDGNR